MTGLPLWGIGTGVMKQYVANRFSGKREVVPAPSIGPGVGGSERIGKNRCINLSFAAIFTAAMLWAGISVQAATWFVKPGGAGLLNGTSWGNAAASIQAAVNAASSSDEIWVAQGTYTSTANPVVNIKAGVSVYGGFLGTETDLIQRNWTTRTTTIDGENARRCVTIESGATLDGFTVRRGSSTFHDSPYGGGGINNQGTVRNCTISQNTNSGQYAGGIMNWGLMENCIVSQNSITDDWSNWGGGIFNNTGATVSSCIVSGNTVTVGEGGGIYNSSGGLVLNCTITGNNVLSGSGGGIYNRGTVNSCSISGNTASDTIDYSTVKGGGVHNLSGAKLTDCIVSGNTATAAGSNSTVSGGGVYNAGTIDGCTLSTNQAITNAEYGRTYGGGIYNENGATVENCTITANASYAKGKYGNNSCAGLGGGIYNIAGGSITECTIANNNASCDEGDGQGGGIYNAGSVTACRIYSNTADGQLRSLVGTYSSYGSGGGIYNRGGLTNCVILKNIAISGGGICNENDATVINCTIARNSANYGSGIANNGTVTNCIVWQNSRSDVGGSRPSYSCTGEVLDGDNSNLRADPLFISMNGTDPAAWDLRLQNGSPCIDSASSTAAPITDIAGNPRPGSDGLVCMGAYESPDAYLPAAPGPPQIVYVKPTGNNTTGQDWTTAFRTITRALQEIPASSALIEIRIAAGTYREGRECLIPSWTTMLGGWSGNPASPEERDLAVFKSIVDGENTHRGISNYGILDGMVVQNGRADEAGGILNYGIVMNCTVSGNTATVVHSGGNGSGGGIVNYGTVENCTVSGNTAPAFGGISNRGGRITGCTVSDNTATSQYAGGILNYGGLVADCSITGNVVTGHGGGVYQNSGTLTNCIISGNTATLGYGGVFSNGGKVTNCVISGNTANGYNQGAGICNYGTTTNCTIVRNTATNGTDGSGVYCIPVMTNCIAWGNSPNDSSSGGSYSCFGEASGGTNLNADPMFVSIAGTDPLAWDLRLQHGSPCFGSGSPSAPQMPETDIAGNPRPGTDGLVCIGAYELEHASNIGTVIIEVTPETASWTLHQSCGCFLRGIGNASLPALATGTLSLTWDTLGGYFAPVPNPATDTIDTGETVTFSGVYTGPHFYQVDFQTDGTAGASLTGATSQSIPLWENSTPVTATTPPGYRFLNWTKDEAEYSTDNPLTVASVTESMTLTARFIKTWTLTYSAESGGTIAGANPQIVDQDGNGTAVTAVPDAGYRFAQWSDGVSTAERTDTGISEDVSVSAQFIKTWTLIYTAGAGGSVEGPSSQTVDNGASGAAVTAVAEAGYFFDQWSDGVTENPRTDTDVSGDISVSAVFGHIVLEWDEIASPQTANQPIPVRIVAKSGVSGATMTDFAGPVDLRIVSMSTIGSGAWPLSYPISTFSHDKRTQTIYLPEEIGGAGQIASLALNVSQIPGRTLGNWTIRMKHTPLRTYSSALWESTGWTIVYQANQTISTTGWVSFTLSNAFDYNGSDGLLVDFSFNNSASTTGGLTLSSFPGGARSLLAQANSTYGDPLLWAGGNPTPSMSTYVPNLQLLISKPTAPSQSGVFVGGVWSGDITVGDSGSNVQLRAEIAGNPHGDSNVFTILDEIFQVAFQTDGTAGAWIEGATTQLVVSGADCTSVTACAPAGCHFVNWTRDGADYSSINPLIVTDVTESFALVAHFATNIYTLSYSAGPNGTVIGTPLQSVEHGESGVEIEAIPSEGYRFVQWSDGVTDNPRIDIGVTGDIIVTAIFEIETDVRGWLRY